MIFEINGQLIKRIESPTMVEGTVDYFEAEFRFSEEWDGLAKEVYFVKGEEKHKFVLTGNQITRDMHLNLTSGTWKVAVYGLDPNGSMIITTDPCSVYIESTLDRDGIIPPETPPSEIDQILQKSQNAENIANEVKTKADNGDFDGYSPSAKVEEVEGKAVVTITDKTGTTSVEITAGIDGKTPVKGVDYFTPAEIEQIENDSASKVVVPTKTSELTNDSGFLTEHQSLNDYYNKASIDEFLDGKQIKGDYALKSDLIPKADKTYVDEKITPKADKSYSDSTFAPVIKVTKEGTAISIDDISEIPQTVPVKVSGVADLSATKVKAMGKNILDYKKAEPRVGGQTITPIENGVKWFGNYFFKIPCYVPKGQEITFDCVTDTRKNGVYRLVYSDGTDGSDIIYGESTISEKDVIYVQIWASTGSETEKERIYTNLQLEINPIPTAFEPYKEPVIYPVSSDGTASVQSVSPNMTLLSDTEGVSLEATYNADTKKYIDKKIEEISKAVVSLGGI